MNRRTAGLAAVLAAAAVAATGCGVGLQQLPIGRSGEGETYQMTAVFDGADRVDPGTEVRVGQAVVGRVRSISTDGRRAFLELSMSEWAELPANVAASVRLPSALGSPFVQIDLPGQPSPEPLADGDVIERTERGPELEATFAMLGQIVSGSGLDELRTITTELTTAFGGRGDKIRTLLERMDRTMALAAGNGDHLARTLRAADDVTARLAQQQQLIDDGIASSAEIVDLLAAQEADLRSLVSSTSTMLTSLDAIMADSGRMGGSVDDIAEILAGIRDFNRTVGSALTNMDAFVDGFNRSVHGDYLLFDGAFDVPGAIDMLLTGGVPMPAASPPVTVPSGLPDLLQGGLR